MNTDRELLELAAKAAGIEYHIDHLDGTPKLVANNYGAVWNPLYSDGQALRLAVKLDLHVQCDFKEESSKVYVYGGWVGNGIEEEPGELDKFGATRRAIVRAAAEIGRSMP
ncbi:hypothetical protein D9M68_852090 [compost metagenome]